MLKIDCIEKLSLLPEKTFESLRNLNTTGSKEREERAEEWTGLMPVYPIHSKLCNFQIFWQVQSYFFVF